MELDTFDKQLLINGLNLILNKILVNNFMISKESFKEGESRNDYIIRCIKEKKLDKEKQAMLFRIVSLQRKILSNHLDMLVDQNIYI